jgi:hypothetical protein
VSSIGEALVIDAAALWFAVVASLMFAVTWAGDRGLPSQLRAGREAATGALRWVDAIVLGALTVGPQVLVLLAALGPYRDFDTPSTLILLAEPPLAIVWWWYLTKRYERAERENRTRVRT